MKNLIKIAGLMAFSTVFAGDSLHPTSEDILYMEANSPVGFEINNKGEIISDNTKAMVDEDRPVGGTSIRYYSASASAMQTVNPGSDTYTYGFAGCKESTNGWINIDDSVDLPVGSKIVSFSAFGKDNSNSAQGQAWLSKFNIRDGLYLDLEDYSTGVTATPGRFSIGGFLGYKLTYDDGIRVRLRGTDPSITLCGFRIGYVPPDVANDIIFVNNFYR